MIANSMIDLIGHTPLLKLKLKKSNWDVYLKLESFNPGGSMKDRMALSMITGAEREGKISPGGTIIESSSGNTAIGLAIVSLCKGYKFIAVVDHHASKQKIKMISALGGEIVVVGDDYPENEVAVVERERVALELSKQIPNSFFVNQANNLYNRAAYIDTLAREIVDDIGTICELYGAIGTGGSLCGTAIGLKNRFPNVIVNAVEPKGSVIFGGKGGAYYQSGTGNPEGAEIPEIIDYSVINRNMFASDSEAFTTCLYMAQKIGLFVGGSSGGVIYKAVEDIQENKTGKGTAVVIVCDNGERYLDTIFDESWLSKRNLYDSAVISKLDRWIEV